MSAIDRIHDLETSTREEQLRDQLADALKQQNDLKFQRDISWACCALVALGFIALVLERGDAIRHAVMVERLDLAVACVARNIDLKKNLNACLAAGAR